MKNSKIIIILCLFLSVASAQEEQNPLNSKPVDPKALVAPGKAGRIKLNFEDELIQGKRDNPELMMMNLRKRPAFKKLLKLRENFNPEMDRSKNAFQK